MGVFKNSKTLCVGPKGHLERSIENRSLSMFIYWRILLWQNRNWVSTFLLTANRAGKAKGTWVIFFSLKSKSKSTNSSTSEQKNLLTIKNKSSLKGKLESIAGLFRQKKEQMHKSLALLQHSVYKTFNAVFPCQLRVSIGFTFQL